VRRCLTDDGEKARLGLANPTAAQRVTVSRALNRLGEGVDRSLEREEDTAGQWVSVASEAKHSTMTRLPPASVSMMTHARNRLLGAV
jgi:hypothetical protein